MATTGAGAAPLQFSRLLRQSRLASFDPAIPQVYTTPPAYAARGDWGLKRPLPSNSGSALPGSSSGSGGGGVADYPGALRYVEVNHIDTPEGQTTWKEREKEVLFLKRWAEADTQISSERASSVDNYRAGARGPRPHTSFLSSTERYFPSEIPGPIEITPRELAKETEEERSARLYNNKWRAMMKHHAERGIADPAYKGLDYMGEQSPSRAFGYDADKFTTRPRMTINYNALDDKQFDRFVERIRDSRPKWIRFFEKKERARVLGVIRKKQEKEYAIALEAYKEAEKRGTPKEPLPKVDPEATLAQMEPPKPDMLEQSRDLDATRVAFRLLEEQTVKSTTDKHNTRLPGSSQPTTMHPHAALQYSQPDLVYANMLAEPLPGRVVHEISSKNSMRVGTVRYGDGRSVLLGGHVSYLAAPMRMHAPPTIDWSRQDPKKGTALFRIYKAYRTSKLTLGSGMHRDMLSPRPDLGYLNSDVEVINSDVDAPRTLIEAPIGSPEYVGKAAQDDSKPIRLAPGASGGAKSRSQSGYFTVNERRKAEMHRQRKVGRALNRGAPGSSGESEETKKMFENLGSLIGGNRSPASRGEQKREPEQP